MNVSGFFPREAWRFRRQEMESSAWCHTPWGRRRTGLLSHVLPVVEPILKRMPLYRRGIRNALDVRLQTVELTFDDLPRAFDGFSILHLSDLHAVTLPGLMDRAGALVEELPVDLAVATGDFQFRGEPSGEETADLIAPLFQRIRSRHGIVAVLGNHDRNDMADALGRLGVRVLLNEHLAVRSKGAELHFTGLDDVYRFYTEDAARALQTGPKGFRILLVHSPDLAQMAEGAGIRLYLTGHTHGGQICLPGGYPITTATRCSRRLARGAWSLGRLKGYTTSGVGSGLPPVRFHSRGEIVHITLRAGGLRLLDVASIPAAARGEIAAE